jgi:uncharacterized protein (TIGR03086 family)
VENSQDSVATRPLRRAFASTRAVLAEVGPEHLEAATPCASWDVRALIEHFVGSARWGASVVTGLSADSAGSGDLLGTYDDCAGAALAAFGAAGVLDRTFELPFGVFSGDDLMGLVARDQFTHGWDLARAIGHGTDLDPELAEELLVRARVEILDAYRGDSFGPALEAPHGACPADRLAAFLGRTV